MKIFCVTDITAVERGEAFPWYVLPDSSVVRSHNPFFIPEFDSEFMGATALVVKIGRLGKSISSKFAPRYFTECTLGVTVWGETLRRRLLEVGSFPAPAMCFDRAFWVGEFVAADALKSSEVKFVRGDEQTPVDLSAVFASVPAVIEALSASNALKMGDMIAIRIPGGEFPLQAPQRVGFMNGDTQLLEIKVK